MPGAVNSDGSSTSIGWLKGEKYARKRIPLKYNTLKIEYNMQKTDDTICLRLDSTFQTLLYKFRTE